MLGGCISKGGGGGGSEIGENRSKVQTSFVKLICPKGIMDSIVILIYMKVVKRTDLKVFLTKNVTI